MKTQKQSTPERQSKMKKETADGGFVLVLRHSATAGENTIAMAAGPYCTVSTGANGCFATAYWDETAKRFRILVGYAGEDGIEAGKKYSIQNGKFVEVN